MLTHTKMKKYDEYARIADVNEHKDINDIVVGDFVWGCTGNGKENSICQLIRSASGRQVLLKVVEVRDVGELLMNGFMRQKPPRNRGGSQSEDVPDGVPMWELTQEQIGTFYQCVTMYRCGDKALYVDCQGYDYWRYVYMPTDYAHMFAEAYKIARALEEARDAEYEAEIQLKRATITAREAELRATWYGVLREDPADGRSMAANVRDYLAAFKVKAKVTAQRHSYLYGYDVTITLANAADKDNAEELIRKWQEEFPTGETASDGYGYGAEIYSMPYAIFGKISEYTIQ